MTARAATVLPVLLLAPLLAGCIGETLDVALRVPAGETLRISRDRHVDGTLLVERGATLVLDDADLTVEQALVVEGVLSSTGSRITFRGSYARQDLDLRGGSVVTLLDTDLVAARDVTGAGGELLVQGGRLETARIHLAGTSLLSTDAAWTVGPSTRGSSQGGASVLVDGGVLDVANGSFAFAPGPGGLLVARGGQAALRNLTLDLSPLEDGGHLYVAEGRLDLVGVALKARPLVPILALDGGLARLVDTPLPREAMPPEFVREGRFEVGWTLTARVVQVPGNAPVAGANVTLQSAHDPAAVSASGTTDEDGEVRLVALQYVVDQEASRPGNPHVVRAQADGGRQGVSPAFVVERPATVLVPVAGGAYAANSANQLSGSQPASLPSR